MPWKDRYTLSDEIAMADADVRWPGKAQCCSMIFVALTDAEHADGLRPADLATGRAQFTMGEGLDLMLEALAKRRLKATFTVPAAMARVWPARIREVAAAGHEIAALGLRHEDVSKLARDDEAARLALTTEIIGEVVGQRPDGWFALPRQNDAFATGAISESTLSLLIDGGYRYMGPGLADDAPHYCCPDYASRRTIVALPYYYHYDDQFFSMFPQQGSGLETTDMMARNWRAELAAQYRRGRCFALYLNPRFIGWCNRMQLLDEFLDELAALPRLWNPTGRECTDHWLATYPPATHFKLEPSVWKDYSDSAS